MNNFETIIGIEIHLELNTKSKMFSSSHNNFKSKPNENISIIDIGYPGALPIPNKEAVKKSLQLAKALEMKVDNEIHFDRKHYFYPDLPKGYQITQQFRPIGKEGKIKLNSGKVITIERIHMEEDTAKSKRVEEGLLLDYNRAGVPLIEIVSDPVIRNGEEAADYINQIRMLASFLDISDAKMEEGSLRADVNISIRPHGQKEFGTKVEIKNINSINNVKKAIEIEVKNQIKKVISGDIIIQETKRFDDDKNNVVSMRVKSDAIDYKYFPEPNIPIIKLSDEFIDKIKNPILPQELASLLSEQNVADEFIEQFLNDKDKFIFFDSIKYPNREKLAKVFFSEIVALANSKNKTVRELNIEPSEISLLLKEVDKGTISGKHLKTIILKLPNNGKTLDIINKENLKQISDKKILNEFIDKILIVNKNFIDNNYDRPERITKFLVGQVMKESKGQANPIISNELVQERVSEFIQKKA